MENEKIKMLFGKLKKTLHNAIKEIGTMHTFESNGIDYKTIEDAYIDFRLIPTMTVFDGTPPINESFGDILPPDIVVKKIINKYGLPAQFVRKVEAYHNIYIYIMTALVGDNDKLIEKDMKKMGYFLGHRKPPQTINGMTFQVLQFEPESQLQNDETNSIRKNCKNLYHWTPMYNVNSVMNYGLFPNHRNKKFFYPSRIYLMEDTFDLQKILDLGQKLCFVNDSVKNNGEYGLLRVDVQKLGNGVKLYYDSNSEIGVYTEDNIGKNAISFLERYKFKTRNQS